MKFGFTSAAFRIAVALLACCLCCFARKFSGEGLLLAVDREHATATISHKEIPGLMPAMVMEFPIMRTQLRADLHAGSRIRFDLQRNRQHSVIEKIWIVRPPALDGAELISKPKMASLAIGQQVPDFRLLTQQGELFDLFSTRGSLTLIQFIYTRCPMADVCPRLSSNFAYLQKKFGPRVELLSVTLDPKWDRPARLAEYAQRWSADTRHWRFLTGTEEEVRAIADRFGIVYWAEEGAMIHSSTVAMIGPNGRLLATVNGSAYPVKQLADLVEHELRRAETAEDSTAAAVSQKRD